MSFNIGSALTTGVETLLTTGNPVAAGVGAAVGAFEGGGATSSAGSSLDPLSLETALSQQTSCFTNINTLSSLAQSSPQSDKLLASLIDGDES
jgi:hypothetical protein